MLTESSLRRFTMLGFEKVLSAANGGDKTKVIEALVEFLETQPGRKVVGKVKRSEAIVVAGKLCALQSIELFKSGDFIIRCELKAWPKGTGIVWVRPDGSHGIVNWK
jgi:hypothetical protein